MRVIRDFEALALLAGATELSELAGSMLASLPDRAFTGGIITNIDDLSGLIRRSPATRAEAETHFPVYTSAIPQAVASQRDPHIAPIFAGQLSLALLEASTPLAKEELASACAIAGHFDDALRVLQHEDFQPERRVGPRIVLCIEAFRARRPELADRLIVEHFSTPGQRAQLNVAAGLLGRVPWSSYPYPDC